MSKESGKRRREIRKRMYPRIWVCPFCDAVRASNPHPFNLMMGHIRALHLKRNDISFIKATEFECWCGKKLSKFSGDGKYAYAENVINHTNYCPVILEELETARFLNQMGKLKQHDESR